ncbi:ribbon-helix-helix protein, CopG family [Synechococcus sp. Lug-A]|nr:ribbon-helix-helix protein, CopG family [Synechococcus sp. Lug-A]
MPAVCGAYTRRLAMQRTRIYLSEPERQGLLALAQRSGRSQSALIREAIDRFLENKQPEERLAKLRKGRGLWSAGTRPLDGLKLRQELDRIPPEGG